MKEYHISRNSTIILNLRLSGGIQWPKNPNGVASIKDVVQGNAFNLVDELQFNIGHYILEQMQQVPTMEVNHSLFFALQSKVVVCMFNGFWPRYDALQ